MCAFTPSLLWFLNYSFFEVKCVAKQWNFEIKPPKTNMISNSNVINVSCKSGRQRLTLIVCTSKFFRVNNIVI